MRCTKKGMLEGIFAGSTNEEVCSRLLELITKFGIGPYKDNSYYNKFMLIENAYSNFHFVDDSFYDDYFNYGMIIPLKDKIEIKAKPSELSNTINYLPFKAMPYANEPGMGIRSEDANFYWLEHNGGFFKSSDVLTGFDYTFVIFEKTPSGWKITGFIQPPGC